MQDEHGSRDSGSDDIVASQLTLPKWVLWGSGLAIAAAVVAAAITNSGSENWSDSSTEKAVSENKVAQNATVARPEPEIAKRSNVRGVITAKEESTIASRMTARIVSMPFGKGESFRRGALLAGFDCSTIRAQLAAARAAAAAYQKTYETNVELDQYEAVGKNEVAVSQANLGKASAEANAVRAQLSDCAVYAPFSGTVVEEIAHRGEVAASGQPLLRIQSGGDLEAELIVPSNWLTWLRPGASFTFKVDETGGTVNGIVTSLGAAVDPVSKTIRITGSVEKTNDLLLPGMSGSAVFDRTEADSDSRAAAAKASTPSARNNGRAPS